MCVCLCDQTHEDQITTCESHTSHFTICICSVEYTMADMVVHLLIEPDLPDSKYL